MFPLFSDLVAKQIQVYNNELCTVQKESNGFFSFPLMSQPISFFSGQKRSVVFTMYRNHPQKGAVRIGEIILPCQNAIIIYN